MNTQTSVVRTWALSVEEAIRILSWPVEVGDSKQIDETITRVILHNGPSRQMWELDTARCIFYRVDDRAQVTP